MKDPFGPPGPRADLALASDILALRPKAALRLLSSAVQAKWRKRWGGGGVEPMKRAQKFGRNLWKKMKKIERKTTYKCFSTMLLVHSLGLLSKIYKMDLKREQVDSTAWWFYQYWWWYDKGQNLWSSAFRSWILSRCWCKWWLIKDGG